MILERFPEVKGLSLSEKAQLVEELQHEIEEDFYNMPVDPELVAQMERDLEEYRRDPSKGKTWEEVRDGILRRAGKLA